MLEFQVKIQNQFYSNPKKQRIKQNDKNKSPLLPPLAPYTHISPQYLMRYKKYTKSSYKKSRIKSEKPQNILFGSKSLTYNTSLSNSFYKKFLQNLSRPEFRKQKQAIFASNKRPNKEIQMQIKSSDQTSFIKVMLQQQYKQKHTKNKNRRMFSREENFPAKNQNIRQHFELSQKMITISQDDFQKSIGCYQNQTLFFLSYLIEIILFLFDQGAVNLKLQICMHIEFIIYNYYHRVSNRFTILQMKMIKLWMEGSAYIQYLVNKEAINKINSQLLDDVIKVLWQVLSSYASVFDKLANFVNLQLLQNQQSH